MIIDGAIQSIYLSSLYISFVLKAPEELNKKRAFEEI